MESGDSSSIPGNCAPRDPHLLIDKLAQLFDSTLAKQCTQRRILLLDELLLATPFGFYTCDLHCLVKILVGLTDSFADTPIYRPKLEALLEKCLVPPLLRKSSDLLACNYHLQQFLSCLGYMLLTLYEEEVVYNLIIDVLYNLLIRCDIKFPPCCVSEQTCSNLLMKSDLPHVIGQLLSVAGHDCFIKMLEFADILLDISGDISIPFVEAGIMDHILLKLIPSVTNYNILNTEDTFEYALVDNMYFISNFFVKLLMSLRALPRARIKHLSPPDVVAMWCFRYTFKYFFRHKFSALYRNNLMIVILLWLELFPKFLFVHSGLADDIYLLSSSDFGVDEKHAWAADLKFSSDPLPYRFKQMLLYSIWLSVDCGTYAAVLQNYNIMPCLLKLLTPDQNTCWLPEQYRKLVKITLSCLEKMFPLGTGVKDFVKLDGTACLLKLLAYYKDSPKHSSMVFGCCRTINVLLELEDKVIFVSMMKGGILELLTSVASGYLKRTLLTGVDNTALAITFLTMARFYKHCEKCPDALNALLLLFFDRVKTNAHHDFISDPKCVIAALKLLHITTMRCPQMLLPFVERGGAYLLLDILGAACYPVRLSILTLIISMCEIECAIPYLLTWRAHGRTLMQLLLHVFKEDLLLSGANVDRRCVIQDVERPLISKRQWQEITSKTKQTNFSPVIIGMIGSCQPKIYAILHLLKFINVEAIGIINEEYRIWTEELAAKDRIVLVLCENYMKIKVGETWMEVTRDIKKSQFIPTAMDSHLLHLLEQHHILWNERLRHIQERVLLEAENVEFSREVDFYQKVKDSKLSLSLEALLELQFIAKTSDNIFKQMQKIRERRSLYDDELKLHRTYVSHFNINAMCNQRVIMETDKLLESKKDWETDFTDLKEVSPMDSSISFEGTIKKS